MTPRAHPACASRLRDNNSMLAWQPTLWKGLWGGSPQLHISGQTLTKIETQIWRKITGWNLQTSSGAVLWTENRSQTLEWLTGKVEYGEDGACNMVQILDHTCPQNVLCNTQSFVHMWVARNYWHSRQQRGSHNIGSIVPSLPMTESIYPCG